MKYKYIIMWCVFTVCVMTGCGGRETNAVLTHVDSLISMNKDGLAFAILDGIDEKGLKDDGDIAYYNLLMAQVRYRLYLPPLQNTALMEKSIKYFKEKGKDDELLARSYYYKGVTDEERGNVKSAILNLKNAENTAKKTDNDELKNKIFKSLAFINYRNDEYSLALEYGKKSLCLSKKLKKSENIAFALNVIAIAYGGLGKEDSADYYISKIIPYLKDIRKKEKATLLNNIYACNNKLGKGRTIKYLKESYDIDSSSVACSNLARYYYKMGMKEKSDKMWEKAMEEKDLGLLINYTRGLIKQREDEGRYKEVGELSKRLLVLSDSLRHKHQEENIKDLQAEYDGRMSKAKAENMIRLLLCSMVIMLLVVALVVIHNKRRVEKARARLMEESMRMQGLKSKIAELEKENEKGKENEKLIDDMKRALAKLNEKHAMALSKGRELYEHIKGGGNTLKWKKSDFVDFIDYYWSVDMAFVSEIRTNYDGLSPKYQFYLILQHLGYDAPDIERIISVSNSAIRSMKSRIRQRQI